jgi:hypothetical protein
VKRKAQLFLVAETQVQQIENEPIASGGFAHIDSIPDENEQIELQEKSGTSMRSLKDLSVKDSESILVDDSESDMTVSVVMMLMTQRSTERSQ